MIKRMGVSIVVLLLTMSQPFAQTASVIVDIGPCLAMDTDTDRYSCYDRLEAQVRATQVFEVEQNVPVVSIRRNTEQNKQQVGVIADEERTPISTEVEDFGKEEDPQAAFRRETNARVLSSEEGDQLLVDTIFSTVEIIPDQWEVTLSSGQVWRQVNSKKYRLREGMEVRVYPSPFGGSFRLSASGVNGFIQVRRVQ
jgi:hypothetical protein